MKAPKYALVALSSLALTLFGAMASAQVDLSGNWAATDSPDQLDQAEGPYQADFVGIPENAQGRAMTATADPSEEQEELYRQCANWEVNYFVEGPFPIFFRPIVSPLDGNDVLAWHMSGTPDREPETVWVNGRAPPPPQALHTWAGFASGQWQGYTLAVHITHLKDNWMLRNDAPESNQATVNMFLTREGDLLTMLFVIHDPVYLGAAYPRARIFKLNEGSPTYNIPTYNQCMPAEVIQGLSDGYHAARYLPGQNPAIRFMERFHIPPPVAVGGTDEIYPQFAKTMLTKYHYTIPPGYCPRDCCAAQAIFGTRCPAPPKAAPGPKNGNEPRTRAGPRRG